MQSAERHINSLGLKAPEMKHIRDDVCEDCGERVQIYEMEIIGGERKGEKMRVPYGCKCEDQALARESMRLQKQTRFKKLKRRFLDHSLINPDLLEATFKNFEAASDSQQQAKDEAAEFIRDFPEKPARNLSFHGSFGVGKSHLAKGVADEIIKKGYTAIFIAVPMLLRKIRATYQKDAETTEDQLIELLTNVDLLVLDDIGAERSTEWTTERLFDLVNARQGKATVYTSNYSPDALYNLFGERDYSRMKYRTKQIEIDGTNYRMSEGG